MTHSLTKNSVAVTLLLTIPCAAYAQSSSENRDVAALSGGSDVGVRENPRQRTVNIDRSSDVAWR